MNNTIKGIIQSIESMVLTIGKKSLEIYVITSGIQITINVLLENKKTIKYIVQVGKDNLPEDIKKEIRGGFFRPLSFRKNDNQLNNLIEERIKSDYNVYIGKEVTIYQNPEDLEDLVMKDPFEDHKS